MVLLHPDNNSTNSESWTRNGNKQEMLQFYKDWNPQLRNLLSYAPEENVIEWTLNTHLSLPTWYINKVVLIGDACHPMLPYVAQGAAQAIEDAGVLQIALAHSSTDIGLALKVYEDIRKERGETVQASAMLTRHALHLCDGPEQRERDECIKAVGIGKGRNPDLWADKEFQRFVWGTDVMALAWSRVVEWKERLEVVTQAML